MKNITDYLEKEHVDQVLEAAHQCSKRDYLMLRVFWRTGVRVNELLNIRPSDIETRNGVVNIIKAKGGKQRRAHLDAETIKMLSEYVSAQQLHELRHEKYHCYLPNFRVSVAIKVPRTRRPKSACTEV